MATQQYEIEAWLGDDHGLSDEQVRELTAISDEIDARYPGADDAEERNAALTSAYRVLAGDETVVENLAAERDRARIAETRALAGLRQVATMLVPDAESEAGYARRASVDRMAVRGWLGKR